MLAVNAYCAYVGIRTSLVPLSGSSRIGKTRDRKRKAKKQKQKQIISICYSYNNGDYPAIQPAVTMLNKSTESHP